MGGSKKEQEGGGFDSYVATTSHPGPWLLYGTVLLCSFLFLVPVVLLWRKLNQPKKQRKRRRKVTVVPEQLLENTAIELVDTNDEDEERNDNDWSSDDDDEEEESTTKPRGRTKKWTSRRLHSWNEIMAAPLWKRSSGGDAAPPKDDDDDDDDETVRAVKIMRGRPKKWATRRLRAWNNAIAAGPVWKRLVNPRRRERHDAIENNVDQHASSHDGPMRDEKEHWFVDMLTAGYYKEFNDDNNNGPSSTPPPPAAAAAGARWASRSKSAKQSKGGDDAKLAEHHPRPAAKANKRWRICRYCRKLIRHDSETRKILQLAVPYTIAALVSSTMDLLTLAVIGHLLAVELSKMLLDGLLASLTTLCSQAVGAQKRVLAGLYVQMAVVTYLLLFAPQIVVWFAYFDRLMLWMDFDQESVDIGQAYINVYVFLVVGEMLEQAFHLLLEVTEHAMFMAVAEGLNQTIAFGVVLFVAWFQQEPSLRTVGYIQVGVQGIFLACEMCYVCCCTTWMRDFAPGLVRRWAFSSDNFRAVGVFFQTAVPQSLGYVLSYGEWEILFLFVSVLGPAEVAAFGLLGEIWQVLESITEAWGDAAEVRCAHLLAAGNAKRARLSAHKSLLLGTASAVVASSLLAALLLLANLPAFWTEDATLQSMVKECMPLLIVGNIFLALETLSWQLVGSQARFGLATLVQCVGSWVVTIPLALVSCVLLRWDLSGVVAAVVIGCVVSGAINWGIVLLTDWDRAAERVFRKTALSCADDDFGEDGLLREPLGTSNTSRVELAEIERRPKHLPGLGALKKIGSSSKRDNYYSARNNHKTESKDSSSSPLARNPASSIITRPVASPPERGGLEYYTKFPYLGATTSNSMFATTRRANEKNNHFEDLDWNELPPDVKRAAAVCGYSQKIWDNDGDSRFDDYDWDELPEKVQAAAAVLGYNEDKWNAS